MRAGFIDKIGDEQFKALFIEDAKEPEVLGPKDVKIQVKVCGICGSEVHAYHGKHGWRVPPLVSGHEFSGVVTEVGTDVEDVVVGQRVTAEPQYGCGECIFCKIGKYNLCENKKILGATYWSGSFGEYVVVPEHCVIPLGENMSFEQGALIEPLAVGMHAVRTNEVMCDDTIAVIGCGTIGLGVILSAKRYNPKKIIAIDVVDYNLEKAKELGADLTFNSIKEADYIETILKNTDGVGVDITFLAFGNATCVKTAGLITRRGGTISQIAVMPDDKVVAPFALTQVKELEFKGSNMFTKDDFKEVIDGIDCGDIKLDGFVTQRYSIENFHDAMECADKRPEPVVKVVLEF